MSNSITEHLTITEQNRLAITRRATKLIDLLNRDECAFVSHPVSTDKLIKIVDLVIYALEQSVEKEDWLPYLRQFREVKYHMYKVADCDGDTVAENTVYNQGIVMLIARLEDYRDFVQEYSFRVK